MILYCCASLLTRIYFFFATLRNHFYTDENGNDHEVEFGDDNHDHGNVNDDGYDDDDQKFVDVEAALY